MNPQVEMEQRALWRALDGVSERLLRASEDMALSELRGLRTELEELARQALQTSAAQPARTSTATGKTSATTENPIAATGISKTTTDISGTTAGKPKTTAGDSGTLAGAACAARENPPIPSAGRVLALVRAGVALRSTFPPDEALTASLLEAAAREVQSCPPDSHKALCLAWLYAATYAGCWRHEALRLLAHMRPDACTAEARTLLQAAALAG